jgi:DNA-binding SARP family transcriptional activator
MGTLRISLFGSVRVTNDNGANEIKLTPIIQAFLAYLILGRHRTYPRESLAGLFWGEQSQEKARGSLNTAIWRLRRALDSDGSSNDAYILTTHTGELGFNRDSEYWLDVAVIEDQVRRVITRPVETISAADAQELEKALELYQGELLEGFYDDWVLRERESLRMKYISGLSYLLGYYKLRQEWEKCLVFGQRILDLDPLREEIHREMMRLYLASGQRTLAVRQYQICREYLETELDLPPMEETEALYLQIISEGNQPVQAAGHPVSLKRIQPVADRENSVGLKSATRQLQLAAENLELARQQFLQAVRSLERFSDRRV